MPHDFQERLVIAGTGAGNIINDEHLMRYELVKRQVQGKIVLDIACGSGYGSEILAKAGAAKVIAVDRSQQAIAGVAKNFAQENIDYRVGEAEKLNLADQSVDVVVSFETIEHLADAPKFLTELKRVVKPAGLVFISTPNREAGTGKNPFHVKEYNKQEFADLLRQYFPACRIFKQFNALASCVISSPDASARILLSGQARPLYFLAVCSPAGALNLDLENIASLNPIALENLYNNPAVKLVNQIYSLAVKIPGMKKFLKSLKPL